VTELKRTWHEPQIEDLGDDVYRIPLPLPSDALRAVNVYAVCAGDRVDLIDGGWALTESQEQLARSLAQIGRDLREIDQILVTHIHRDHYTQAVSLRQQFGLRVGLGAGEQPNLTELIGLFREGSGIPRHFEAMLRAGARELCTMPMEIDPEEGKHWEEPDRWLADDELVTAGTRTLRVIATPGHTAGHVVFHDESAGDLFAGDHVLPHITPSIGFEYDPVRWPLRDYVRSLELIRQRPDARLLPAHGPATDSVHARVDALLTHHERRLDDTLAAVAAGAETAHQAAGILRWTRRERILAELDGFNQRLAIAETLAHLDVLVLQGRLAAQHSDGVAFFAEPAGL
jgi:glyoxylase-like metal-dependent hydrolase (beta-lactamase superfamily II)